MANRTGRGTFQKGVSGNPGGRPKAEKTIQELARKHGPMAIASLAKIAKSGKSESARASAANALLDRGFGRPPQFQIGSADQLKPHEKLVVQIVKWADSEEEAKALEKWGNHSGTAVGGERP